MDKERIINILKLTIVGLQQTAELPSNLILSSGICSHISRLYLNEQITIAERLFMRSLVVANKPDDDHFTEFTQNKYWTGNTFWWTPIAQDKFTINIRISYLRALIDSIK
jgi:hypothetical protein